MILLIITAALIVLLITINVLSETDPTYNIRTVKPNQQTIFLSNGETLNLNRHKEQVMTNNLKPDYYATSGSDLIEHWYDKWGKSADIIMVANVEKYLERYKEKNGMEDLQKAKTYLDRLIAKQKVPLGQSRMVRDEHGNDLWNSLKSSENTNFPLPK